MYCDQWQKSNNLTVNYYSEDIDILGRWGSNVAFLPQFVRAAGLARKNQGYRPENASRYRSPSCSGCLYERALAVTRNYEPGTQSDILGVVVLVGE